MDNQTNIEQTEQRPPQTPPQAGPAQAPNAGAAPARPPQQPRRDERPMPQRPPQGAEQIRRDEKMVYIGKKEAMSYVLAVVTQFNNNLPEVHIKARGKSISRAVDVAEIVRHRFMPDVKVRGIQISTEELASEDGRMSKVSSIEITLSR